MYFACAFTPLVCPGNTGAEGYPATHTCWLAATGICDWLGRSRKMTSKPLADRGKDRKAFESDQNMYIQYKKKRLWYGRICRPQDHVGWSYLPFGSLRSHGAHGRGKLWFTTNLRQFEDPTPT